MNGKVFLDTNIIIYAHTDHDPIKQVKAQAIIMQEDTQISTQVLQEAANTLRKKLKHNYGDIGNVLRDLVFNNDVHINSPSNILSATEIADKYGFSFYDSLIIAAALDSGAETLYSEDMQNGRNIENRLTIVNPFA